jgi:hypothetical protein
VAEWTSEELKRIAVAEELQIASLRRDGTLRGPVTIWVVRQGDELFVRPVNGRNAGCFRGVQVRHEGRMWAGGVEKDVTLVEADDGMNAQLGAEYRSEYRRDAASIAGSIVTPQAQAARIKLVTR